MVWHPRFARVFVLAAVGAASIAASAVPSFGQGFYYKEIRKDDRIYVFNVAANAERFEKTGEMGVGITRPGTGPNGETVVGDNERALQLFYFKHGISEAGARSAPHRRRRPRPTSSAGSCSATTTTSRSSHDPKWDVAAGLLAAPGLLHLRPHLHSAHHHALPPRGRTATASWPAAADHAVREGRLPALDLLRAPAGDARHPADAQLRLRRDLLGPAPHREDAARPLSVGLVARLRRDGVGAAQRGRHPQVRGAVRQRVGLQRSETDKFKAYRVAARYETAIRLLGRGLLLAVRPRQERRPPDGAGVRRLPREARAGSASQYSYQKREGGEGSTRARTWSRTWCRSSACCDAKPQKVSRFRRASTSTTIRAARGARASTTCRSTATRSSPPRSPASSTTSTRRSASARTSSG